jgi:hypothetical protein
VAVAPEGGRRAKVRFGDGFALPSGTGVIFPTWREVPALPIGSFCAGDDAVAPAIYLGSSGCWREFKIIGGAPILILDVQISADPQLEGILREAGKDTLR